jgi:uncharacterized protein
MTDEDVARFRRGYEAFNEGGLGAILKWIAPEIQIRDRDSSPDRQTLEGDPHAHESIIKLFLSTMDAFDEVRFEPREFVEVDDRLLVVLCQRARGRRSGAPVQTEVVHVWTLREGRPVALAIFGDREKAREALGLSGGRSGDPSD